MMFIRQVDENDQQHPHFLILMHVNLNLDEHQLKAVLFEILRSVSENLAALSPADARTRKYHPSVFHPPSRT